MRLYFFAPSHHSRRVLAVINTLGLQVDLDHRDLTKGEHLTPEIKALNPNGFLPILVDGDFALFESNAIMQYLADSQNEIVDSESQEMKMTEDQGNGRYVYRQELPCTRPGRYGLTARVVPRGSDWSSTMPGFTTWANGA